MRLLVFCFSLFSLAGCVVVPTSELIGQSRESIIRVLGEPHTVLQREKSSILVYPRGFSGKGTFFIELDSLSMVRNLEDVLTYKNFRRISVGMNIAEVELIIGPPLSSYSVAKENQRILNYPFENSICQIFQIALLPNGKVAEAGFGFAPECESFGD